VRAQPVSNDPSTTDLGAPSGAREVRVRARLVLVSLLLLLAVAVEAQRAPVPESSDLPVRRVILYKSGVGFFEHVGPVTGNTNVTIQFTTAQLNDVLQSLTTLDLDGGSIASISYNSIAPIEQRLSALRLPLDRDAGREDLFKALRGARVTVRATGVETSGRLARPICDDSFIVPTLWEHTGGLKKKQMAPLSAVAWACCSELRYDSYDVDGKDFGSRRRQGPCTGRRQCMGQSRRPHDP